MQEERSMYDVCSFRVVIGLRAKVVLKLQQSAFTAGRHADRSLKT